MSAARVHGSDLRDVGGLLAAVLEDSYLMSQLSLIEQEHIQGASMALRSLVRLADARDLEDTVNES